MGNPASVIILPWRDKGDPWRRANLGTVIQHLQRTNVTPVAVVDDGRTGAAPFNRSAAYNRGIHAHPETDVYVLHEADMIIPAEQLEQAIASAAQHPGLVIPFDTYHYLTAADTEHVRNGAYPNTLTPEHVMADGRAVGAVNVVSAETMATVGQWDETFEGWGFDDRAMAHAFHVTTGNPTRHIPGAGTHLWHTPGWSVESRFRGGADIPDHEHRATLANEQRYQLYRRARTAKHIRALTTGAA